MRNALSPWLILVVTVAACSDSSNPVMDSRPKDLSGGRDTPLDRRALEASTGDRRIPDSQIAKDVINITCTATVGSGVASGTVHGQAVSTTSSAGVTLIAPGFIVGYGVAFFNQPGACAALAPVLIKPTIMIALCTTKPGTYPVGSKCPQDGGAGLTVNAISAPALGLGSTYQATSGTITIESLDPSCGGKVKGSFTASFAFDTVSGTFDTVGCGEIPAK